ncbi:MAG: glycosyltransferase [Chloroflexi bacterium]|nr:glycosyltransferase [Chloroflexota bacterium]
MKKIVILTPVYNDWDSFAILLQEIERALASSGLVVTVVAVDDGSSQVRAFPPAMVRSLKTIRRVEVLTLARNLGHQKALTIGLAYASENIKGEAVIVMDCDGEDRPADLPRLLAEQQATPQAIIFARRTRRSEGIAFRFFYAVYRLFFRLMTGQSISFGNFCSIPASLLPRVVFLPETWNHFAAGVIRSRLPHRAIPAERGRRFAGNSGMNFIQLVLHGLSAISVYLDVAAVRLILFSLGVILAVALGFGALLYVKYFTLLAIPGWATTVAIGLALIFFQAIFFLTFLSFLALTSRSNRLFIPAKDYRDFIFAIETIRL